MRAGSRQINLLQPSIDHRREEGRKALLDGLGAGCSTDRLDIVVIAFDTDSGAALLKQHLQDHYGEVDHIVSCIGGWWQKGEVPSDTAGDPENLPAGQVLRKTACGNIVH
jgi:hypothetical protein